jgi:hypothetical protein
MIQHLWRDLEITEACQKCISLVESDFLATFKLLCSIHVNVPVRSNYVTQEAVTDTAKTSGLATKEIICFVSIHE